MPNPLLVSINRAVKDNHELAILFGRYLGTARHPRGRILSLYRTHRLAMKTTLMSDPTQAGQVLIELRTAVVAAITEAIDTAVILGQTSAQEQTEAYTAEGVPVLPVRHRPATTVLSRSPIALLNQQIQAIDALIQNGSSVEEIVGDGSRLGMLQPAPIQNDAARWMRTAVSAGFTSWVTGLDGRPLPFRRQAIAAIDERTTTCCLLVHGQIVDLKQDFYLTGTPRFADYQHDPPFHHYCRTSVALYLPEFDDGFTEMMRQAANLEQELRTKPGYTSPHPANAFTRIRQ